VRRPGKHRGWFAMVATVVKVFLYSVTRHEWQGVENIPRDGGVILVANHVTVVDPLTLAHAVYMGAHRLPRFLAKSELFKVAPIRFLLERAGQIPVYRGSRDAALSLRDADAAVRDGECVIIYPEGTCTADPELWPMVAKTGVARLALSTGAVVVPVANWGAHKILAHHEKRPHLFPRKLIKVNVGAPIDLSAYAGAAQTPDLLREVTDLLMGRVTELLAEVRGEKAPAAPYDPRSARAAA
jgi:1-acyl-sn-glycerol-3-phosphate acyltransferase